VYDWSVLSDVASKVSDGFDGFRWLTAFEASLDASDAAR
jgi:hypothetical protein